MGRVNSRPALSTGCAVLGACGLAAAIAGTFLPWLQSGEVRRNSYASAGLLQRLLGLDGALGALLTAWPFLGLFCALVAVGFLAGLRRAAAVGAVVAGGVAVAVAVIALRTSGAGQLRHVATGPIVTVMGGAAAILAATLFLLSHRSHSSRAGRA